MLKKIIAIAGLILLVGCGQPAPVAEPTDPPATPTEALAQAEPSPTATVAAATSTPVPPPATATATLTPTETSLPTATPTPVLPPSPTATATPTEAPEPTVRQINEGLVNVRGGPGTAYPVVGGFQPGAEAMVTGQNEAGTWWQISLMDEAGDTVEGWVLAELVEFDGSAEAIAIAEAPPPPPTATPAPVAETDDGASPDGEAETASAPPSSEALAEELGCTEDFCVTFQSMVPIWENGGCVGNHSIYITVLQGPPPGEPMDGVVIGDTFNNVEVASGSHGPGRTEITLWSNSMTLVAKRHIDGTPYTSQESFNFTSHDELIPAEVLAANGYCDGRVETCRVAQQNNQVCRGHYSWRVTFHKFD